MSSFFSSAFSFLFVKERREGVSWPAWAGFHSSPRGSSLAAAAARVMESLSDGGNILEDIVKAYRLHKKSLTLAQYKPMDRTFPFSFFPLWPLDIGFIQNWDFR